jgi:sec-independent protein translocase protein TatA
VIGDILQPTHLLFVLVVALLVLGPKRLPEVGRSLGKGLRDFKTAIGGEDDHDSHVEAVQNQVEAVQSHASTPPSHVTTESTPPVTAPVEHTG